MKQFTLTLGGVERKLDVGKFYFTKFLGEVLGKDPITDIATDAAGQFKWVCSIIYAGMATAYKVEKKPLDFSMLDVEDWVGTMEAEEVVAIVERYNAATKGE